MVEARVSLLEKTMTEVSADVKYIKSTLEDVKDTLRDFRDQHDKVILLEEKVKNLEEDIKKAPSYKTAGTVATSAGVGAVGIIEFARYLLG